MAKEAVVRSLRYTRTCTSSIPQAFSMYLTASTSYFNTLYSVCPADKDRIKVSLYGGLKLEGEVLVRPPCAPPY